MSRLRRSGMPTWPALAALGVAGLIVVIYVWVLAHAPRALTPASEPSLQVDWQAATIAASPAPSGWQPYGADTLLPRSGDGSWLRVRPIAGRWPDGDRLLVIEQPGYGAISRNVDGREIDRRRWSDGRQPGTWHVLGGLVYAIDADARRDGGIVLRLWPHGELDSHPAFALLTPSQLSLRDTTATLISGCLLATMFAFALLALPAGAMLREPVFFAYALYLGSYTFLFYLISGLAFSPLPASLFTADPQWWGRLATGVAVWAATVFLSGFADLRRYAPRLRWAVLGAGWLVLLPTLATQFDDSIRGFMRHLINPLLVLTGPLLLFTAAWAWWRGSRYAGFFLIGWAPLLTITALESAGVVALRPGTPFGDYGQLSAGLFESFVLMFGLGDRAFALQAALELARRQAVADPLTGLYNRRGWRELLDAEPADVVLYLDIDHFKALNDRYGHAQGDEALRHIGAALQARLRRGDLAARYGGEEFVVALYDCTQEDAAAWAEALRADVHALALGPDGAPLTLSVGVAARRDGERIDRWLERADAAMYAAKQGGRDRVVIAAG
ncbi:GGDEF domain-containing protein [Solimonas marina]|uniref:diguanylate cyclase n=1 Tax=Solimonas marina TaxID=2714601 RepID=A0A970B7M6_9GAMM|nr:diguanylate cyclase [Solimonas marina]NKF23840.1 diguanylate cyclase [Solimonas marina]